jgi:exportin-1
MISAQVDQVVQELLIEKYMMLPNQVWDDIISQASKVRTCLELVTALSAHG